MGFQIFLSMISSVSGVVYDMTYVETNKMSRDKERHPKNGALWNECAVKMTGCSNRNVSISIPLLESHAPDLEN